jgi:hypothetical protein
MSVVWRYTHPTNLAAPILSEEISMHTLQLWLSRNTLNRATLAGYLFTYYNTKVNEERKARIERINEQVPPKFMLNPCWQHNTLATMEALVTVGSEEPRRRRKCEYSAHASKRGPLSGDPLKVTV